MAAEAAFPDAAAGRVAGGAADHFDDATNVLTIRQDGAIAVRGDLETAEGRPRSSSFLPADMRRDQGPQNPYSTGHSFSDVARKVVSIINLASLRAIENMVGQPSPAAVSRQPLCRGWPAWHEFEQLDRTLAIGDIRLKVVKRINRCAAINVDPDTGARDSPSRRH